MWNPVPLVGVLGRPQFLSSTGSAITFVGCTAFAAMGTSFLTGPQAARFAVRAVRGNFFVFWRRGGLCGPFVSTGWFSRSIPSRAVALWGHAALVSGQFLSSPGCAVSLVGCTAYAVRGNFLSLGGSRSLLWRLGLPACWQFLLGGTLGCPYGRPCPLIFVFRRGSIPRRSWRAGAPWFLVSAWGRACTFARFPGSVQAGIALPSGAWPGTSNTKTSQKFTTKSSLTTRQSRESHQRERNLMLSKITKSPRNLKMNLFFDISDDPVTVIMHIAEYSPTAKTPGLADNRFNYKKKNTVMSFINWVPVVKKYMQDIRTKGAFKKRERKGEKKVQTVKNNDRWSPCRDKTNIDRMLNMPKILVYLAL